MIYGTLIIFVHNNFQGYRSSLYIKIIESMSKSQEEKRVAVS